MGASRPTEGIRSSASRSAATAGETPCSSAVRKTRSATSKIPLTLARAREKEKPSRAAPTRVGGGEGEALSLLLGLDPPAGVDQVVGGVQDPPLGQPVGDLRGGQLVV